MKPLDWVVLAASVVLIVAYGLWRARGSNTVNKYLLAGKTMPWYAMALSIMATQASAITFISTTGQAYADGMRFVQFYFGLPLAMVILCATAVPQFHRSGVYTAYQYLERRFDAKTRALVTMIFLIQRGLAVGVALYAPAIVLTVIFGWPDRLTSILMGVIVVFYTAVGGIQAVTWTDFQQMLVMLAGLFAALIMAVLLLPDGVGWSGALAVAGAAGKLNPVVWRLDWNDRYNVWSGLLGGMFLALAYFGTDQSQVQRYLTGRSVTQSRLSLLFNGMAKVPMQFLILLTGALVFSFYVFEKPPLLFNAQERRRIEHLAAYQAAARVYDQAFERRRAAGYEIAAGNRSATHEFQTAHVELERARQMAGHLAAPDYNDTNYIFLTFVTTWLPEGLVGLIIAAIFAAAMSTISAEINSLATVTVIDLYQRYWRPHAPDRHYLIASQAATVFWGLYAILTAQFGRNLGSLIEAVNRLGSLFYGGMLGVFALAFYFPRVNGHAAFLGVLAGEAAIFYAALFTKISFLWYNVIGALVTVGAALALSRWPLLSNSNR